MQSELKQHVKTIIANCLSVNVFMIDDDMQLVDQLYIDSLELLDIVMSLNEKFNIDIGGDELVGFQTVSDVCREVEQQLAANGAIITS